MKAPRPAFRSLTLAASALLLALAVPLTAAAAEPAPQGAETGSGQAAGAAPPHLELTPCDLPGLDGPARCGTYEVWENRAARKGRKIPLRVVVLPATGESPAPDPVLYFAGGPGASAVEEGLAITAGMAELRNSRDIVLVDIRGTGESAPLFCPYQEDDRGIQEALETFLPTDQLDACRQALEKKADLTQYTSANAIDDVDEVRAALGYGEVNLFGGSYGSRAVLIFLRRHPEVVRSAVIIGVAPPGMRSPLSFARDAQVAWEKLLGECAAEEACHAAFPDPAADLAAVLDRVSTQPVTVQVVDPASGEQVPLEVTHNVVVQTVRYMLYQPLPSLQLPAFLHAAAEGNFEPLAQNAYSFAGALMNSLPDGLFLSITCSEDVAFIDPREVAPATQGTFLGDFRVRQQMAACKHWVHSDVTADYNEPVRSSVPVLILSGERDPVTPAHWGEMAGATLPASRHLVVPDGAHGFFGLEGSECIDRLTIAFIEQGNAAGLDLAGCAASIERPPFAQAVQEDEVLELAEAELRRFVGTYRAAEGGMTLTVELVDGSLLGQAAGQSLPLVPVAPLRLKPRGAPPGSYLDFTAGEGEGATLEEVTLLQGGNPVLTFERVEATDEAQQP